MRTPVFILAGLAASCAAPPAVYAPGPVSELAGRVAGPAQRCVQIYPSNTLRLSETNQRTLVYGAGRTIWVNDLGSCGFRRDDIIVTEPLNSRHCNGDIVRSVDQLSHMPGPTCVLGDFVPYRLP